MTHPLTDAQADALATDAELAAEVEEPTPEEERAILLALDAENAAGLEEEREREQPW